MNLSLIKTNIFKKIKPLIAQNKIILSILIVALILRVWNLDFDISNSNLLVKDETYGISYILRLINGQNPFTIDVFPYPILLIVIQLPFVLLQIFAKALFNNLYHIENIKSFYLLYGTDSLLFFPRILSALFGTASVFLIYKIFYLIYNKYIAYIAALAACFNFISIYLSHQARAHSFLITFILLSFYFALKFQISKKIKYLNFSSIFAALSFSTHYLGIMGIILPILNIIFNIKFIKKIDIAKQVFYYGIITLFSYVINAAGVQNMVKNTFVFFYAESGSFSIYPVGGYERFYYIIKDLFLIDPIGITLFFIVLFLWIINKNKNVLEKYFIFTIIFFYFIQIILVASPGVPRWLLPINLLTSCFGFAYLFHRIQIQKLRKDKIKYFVILILLLVPQIILSVKWIALLKNNSHIITTKWLIENINSYNNIFSYSATTNLPYNKEAFLWNLEHDTLIKNSEKNKQRVKILEGANFGYNIYNIKYNKNFVLTCDLISELKINYVILDFGNEKEKNRQYNPIQRCLESKATKKIYPYPNMQTLEIDIVNDPSSLFNIISKTQVTGNYIEIYKTKKN